MTKFEVSSEKTFLIEILSGTKLPPECVESLTLILTFQVRTPPHVKIFGTIVCPLTRNKDTQKLI